MNDRTRECVKDLLAQAAALPADERAAHIAAHAGDATAAREALALLATLDDPAFMAAPTVGRPSSFVRTAVPAPDAGPGQRIGPYKLLERIGEGGMGTVFMAEQTQPVQRKVALKIIKPGMDSRQVIARFEAERQALALMDHQNIAKVYDAGTTTNGRPFFVMELVHGVPITQFCDDHKLTPRERLELFVPVCQALQHAHQKGIIHRDVKPTNVLVTLYDDRPVAKVIDFGVAKAVEQRLTEKTLFTQFGAMVGTYEYMSPEQAEMNAFGVDTRSDIYSLGVLVYELLTSTTPLERRQLREAAFGEVIRLIKEEETPRPSLRLSSSNDLAKIAAARNTDPARLSGMIRGDVDWIVMKCLEKDRTRRYESANGLARDIQRHLADEPVEACPPSTMYRLRKLGHKYRSSLCVAGGFFVLVMLGATVSTWQAVRATGAERTARLNATIAEQRQHEADEAKSMAEGQRDTLASLNTQLRLGKYVADMNLARYAWDENNLARFGELLDEHQPRPGETDLRGFEWYYLRRLSHRELWSIKAHAGVVRSVAYLPDGRQLITAGRVRGQQGMNFATDAPGEIKLWDAATGGERGLTLEDVPKVVWDVALGADGTRLGAACGRQGIRIWDLMTGDVTRLDPPQNEMTTSIAFSPDGQHLVSRGATGPDDRLNECVIRTWKLGDLKPELLFDKLPLSRGSPAYSPDGRLLAYALYDIGRVSVIDAFTGVSVFSCTYEGGAVGHVIFNPDGKRLVGCGERGIQIWEVGTGKPVATWPSDSICALCLAFSRDGKSLAQGGIEGLIELWDADTGHKTTTLKGHAGPIASIGFSPDGKHLASAGDDGTLRVWDLSQPQSAPSPTARELPSSWLVVSPDGRVALKDMLGLNVARLFDLTSGNAIGAPVPRADGLECYDWSADSRRLALPDGKGKINIIDVAPGAVLRTFKVDRDDSDAVALSADGALCAYSVPGGAVAIREVDSGRILRTLPATHATIHNLAFSPDSQRMAAADVDGWVRVFDMATGRQLSETQLAEVYIFRLRFSLDGRSIVAIGMQTPWITGDVRILDAEKGGVLHDLRGHTLNVVDLDLSPDGRRLVTASADRTVRVWDLESGQEVLTLHGHQMPACGVRFVDSGRRLMSVSCDGDVRYWDASPLPNHTAPVHE